MQTSTADVLEWISNHLHVIGWPVLIGVIWKCRGILDKFINRFETIDKRTASTADLATETKAGVDAIATNHLKHIEDDTRENKESLHKIAEGIAVLVDRAKK